MLFSGWLLVNFWAELWIRALPFLPNLGHLEVAVCAPELLAGLAEIAPSVPPTSPFPCIDITP